MKRPRVFIRRSKERYFNENTGRTDFAWDVVCEGKIHDTWHTREEARAHKRVVDPKGWYCRNELCDQSRFIEGTTRPGQWLCPHCGCWNNNDGSESDEIARLQHIHQEEFWRRGRTGTFRVSEGRLWVAEGSKWVEITG